MMKRIATTITTLVVILASLLPSLQAAAWYCEGRVCGSTPWQCCCVELRDQCDPLCVSNLNKQSPSDTSVAVDTAGSQCGCVMVTGQDTPAAIKYPLVLSAPAFISLPITPTTVIEPVTETLIHVSDSRGPPSSLLHHLPHGLRAPPAA